ncbi:hypothetical protein HHL17_31575 [Chitinophaga sp. G-6-1-13]|uniref:Uncharacterized protein n=1 Tax=Chitinophaga fulva TaxID=2728842 RepID=A0A848GWS7_9BACT|nr:hypothetical protein [Chitinophaga fulva]NML41769.1 hypothetical protein [Chitinophaga fulva]
MPSHILKRWMFVCLLMITQLTASVLPSLAAHKHLLFEQIHRQAALEDSLEDLAAKLPPQLEADDVEDDHECIHATKHRRKTRYYLSASSQQFSIATRVAYIEGGNLSQYCLIKENLPGEYGRQKAFLPAYYSFLFRFTPF